MRPIESPTSWHWRDHTIGWSRMGNPNADEAVLLIHFGPTLALQPTSAGRTAAHLHDLLGFGRSDQPRARLKDEPVSVDAVLSLGQQVADFCSEVIDRPVRLWAFIGGVAARGRQPRGFAAAARLIDCAQRPHEIAPQPAWMAWIRPLPKTMVRQRWPSTALFRNAARPGVIRSVLTQAYPSGANINDDLVDLLFQPTQREGATEAFRGFINLFDDYLAPQLMAELSTPVDLIWGEKDPWEPIAEARCWRNSINCVRSLNVIPNAGHCPHDEAPDQVNRVLQRLISSQRAQQAT